MSELTTERVSTLIRRPLAWLPFVMSAGALALVLGFAVLAGPGQPQGHDERAPARLFQLILLGEVLVMANFAVRWLPRVPRQAGLILALQLLAAAVPIATLLVLESRV